MAQLLPTDATQQKSPLRLHQLVWFLGIVPKSLVLFIGILLLSESVAGTPTQFFPLVPTAEPSNAKGGRGESRIAQLPATTSQDATRAAAARALQEGMQLYQQGTVESLRGAIAKWEEALSLVRALGDKAGEALTLASIGRIYSDLGEKQKALEFFNQSLPLWRAVGDRAREALTLISIGRIYSDLGEKQKALEFFNQSLPLYRAVGDREGEALTLNGIGRIYSDWGENQKALEFLNQSLLLCRALGNKVGEAVTLNNIGLVYDALGEKQKALEFYNQSLPLSRAVGNKTGEAATLNNIGGVYSALGEKQKALEFYNQSLPLRREVGDRAGEATTLSNIGAVYSDLGEKQKALEFYNQSLPLSRAVGDKTGEATTLSNIGKVYDDLGEKQKALEFYNQSLPLRRAVGDKAGEALTLNNIGLVYSALGEQQKALEFFNQSLPLSRAVRDRAGEATTLNNIGGVYSALGEKQKALEFFNQSLPLFREVGDKTGEATTLNNIGGVYNALGEKQKALEFFNQSLPLSREVGDKTGEARTLSNIGAFYLALGEKQKALEFLNQSLPLSRAVGDRAMEATILNNIGAFYLALGEKQKGLELLNQSLPLRREVGDKAGEALTLYNFASLERNQGNLNEALTQMEAAINIIEELRTKIASQQLRASYFATVQSYYQFYIDLLMQLHKTNPTKGYDALALHASERSKARSLVELLAEASVNVRSGADSQLRETERNLQQQLNAAEFSRIKLLEGSYSEKQLTEIKQRIENLIAQLDQVQAQIRVQNPAYAAISQPGAFTLTLPQIQQQVLDDNTLLLQYSLGEERSYLWAVTKTGFTTYELPKRADIEAAAKEFRQVLINPNPEESEIATSGAKLSQLILAPVAHQLGNKRLLIVSDRILQYIPFAALPVPEKGGQGGQGGQGSNYSALSSPSPLSSYTPLLVQNEIVSLPSASTLAVLRDQVKNRPQAAKILAALADPVFSRNDPRFQTAQNQQQTATDSKTAVMRACESLDRLEFSGKEADNILTLVPGAKRFAALGFDASRANATRAELSQYQIVHFATHGCVNEDFPELSGVALSQYEPTGANTDGFLRLHDIFNLNLGAELVVLSACKTGIGKEVQGEGLIGLTRGFMYAGAERVVVSLWSVNDVATSQLMQRYYQQMLQKGLNPVQALREAQLEMWRNSQWKAPYYWAAFVVQGEWQD